MITDVILKRISKPVNAIESEKTFDEQNKIESSLQTSASKSEISKDGFAIRKKEEHAEAVQTAKTATQVTAEASFPATASINRGEMHTDVAKVLSQSETVSQINDWHSRENQTQSATEVTENTGVTSIIQDEIKKDNTSEEGKEDINKTCSAPIEEESRKLRIAEQTIEPILRRSASEHTIAKTVKDSRREQSVGSFIEQEETTMITDVILKRISKPVNAIESETTFDEQNKVRSTLQTSASKTEASKDGFAIRKKEEHAETAQTSKSSTKVTAEASFQASPADNLGEFHKDLAKFSNQSETVSQINVWQSHENQTQSATEVMEVTDNSRLNQELITANIIQDKIEESNTLEEGKDDTTKMYSAPFEEESRKLRIAEQTIEPILQRSASEHMIAKTVKDSRREQSAGRFIEQEETTMITDVILKRISKPVNAIESETTFDEQNKVRSSLQTSASKTEASKDGFQIEKKGEIESTSNITKIVNKANAVGNFVSQPRAPPYAEFAVDEKANEEVTTKTLEKMQLSSQFQENQETVQNLIEQRSVSESDQTEVKNKIVEQLENIQRSMEKTFNSRSETASQFSSDVTIESLISEQENTSNRQLSADEKNVIFNFQKQDSASRTDKLVNSDNREQSVGRFIEQEETSMITDVILKRIPKPANAIESEVTFDEHNKLRSSLQTSASKIEGSQDGFGIIKVEQSESVSQVAKTMNREATTATFAASSTAITEMQGMISHDQTNVEANALYKASNEAVQTLSTNESVEEEQTVQASVSQKAQSESFGKVTNDRRREQCEGRYLEQSEESMITDVILKRIPRASSFAEGSTTADEKRIQRESFSVKASEQQSLQEHLTRTVRDESESTEMSESFYEAEDVNKFYKAASIERTDLSAVNKIKVLTKQSESFSETSRNEIMDSSFSEAEYCKTTESSRRLIEKSESLESESFAMSDYTTQRQSDAARMETLRKVFDSTALNEMTDSGDRCLTPDDLDKIYGVEEGQKGVVVRRSKGRGPSELEMRALVRSSTPEGRRSMEPSDSLAGNSVVDSLNQKFIQKFSEPETVTVSSGFYSMSKTEGLQRVFQTQSESDIALKVRESSQETSNLIQSLDMSSADEQANIGITECALQVETRSCKAAGEEHAFLEKEISQPPVEGYTHGLTKSKSCDEANLQLAEKIISSSFLLSESVGATKTQQKAARTIEASAKVPESQSTTMITDVILKRIPRAPQEAESNVSFLQPRTFTGSLGTLASQSLHADEGFTLVKKSPVDVSTTSTMFIPDSEKTQATLKAIESNSESVSTTLISLDEFHSTNEVLKSQSLPAVNVNIRISEPIRPHAEVSTTSSLKSTKQEVHEEASVFTSAKPPKPPKLSQAAKGAFSIAVNETEATLSRQTSQEDAAGTLKDSRREQSVGNFIEQEETSMITDVILKRIPKVANAIESEVTFDEHNKLRSSLQTSASKNERSQDGFGIHKLEQSASVDQVAKSDVLEKIQANFDAASEVATVTAFELNNENTDVLRDATFDGKAHDTGKMEAKASSIAYATADVGAYHQNEVEETKEVNFNLQDKSDLQKTFGIENKTSEKAFKREDSQGAAESLLKDSRREQRVGRFIEQEETSMITDVILKRISKPVNAIESEVTFDEHNKLRSSLQTSASKIEGSQDGFGIHKPDALESVSQTTKVVNEASATGSFKALSTVESGSETALINPLSQEEVKIVHPSIIRENSSANLKAVSFEDSTIDSAIVASPQRCDIQFLQKSASESEVEAHVKPTTEEVKTLETKMVADSMSENSQVIQKSQSKANVDVKVKASGNEKTDVVTSFMTPDEHERTLRTLTSSISCDVNAQLKFAGDEKQNVEASLSSTDQHASIQNVQPSPHQSSTLAHVLSAGDEKQKCDATLISSEIEEKSSGIIKSANEFDLTVRLTESQETMRNLIEQHEIVDTNQTTMRLIGESPRTSQERTFQASSEEMAAVTTNINKSGDSEVKNFIHPSPLAEALITTVQASKEEGANMDCVHSLLEKNEFISKSFDTARNLEAGLETSASKTHSVEREVHIRHEGADIAPETNIIHAISLTEKASLLSDAVKEAVTEAAMELRLPEEEKLIQGTFKQGQEEVISAQALESKETMRNLIEQHSIYDSEGAVATALPSQTHSKFQRTFSDETTSISTDFSSLPPSVSTNITHPETSLSKQEQAFGIDEICSKIELSHEKPITDESSTTFASIMHDKASSTFLQQSQETSNNDVVLMRVPKPVSESQSESVIAEGRKVEECLATNAATLEEVNNEYFVDKKADHDLKAEVLSAEAVAEHTGTKTKAVGDEKKQVDTGFVSAEKQEATFGVMKSASQTEIAAMLKESQETMRNLIEQHEIVDTNLTTVHQVRESPRSSQERSLIAATEEHQLHQTSFAGKGHQEETTSVIKSIRNSDISAKVNAASDESSKVDTTLHSLEEHEKIQSSVKTGNETNVVALLKSTGDEKQNAFATLEAKESKESVTTTQDGSTDVEIAATLKASQQTMRNLIEQHEIIETDLTTSQKICDISRLSQERSLMASSEETNLLETSLSLVGKALDVESLQNTAVQADIAAKMKAARDEKRETNTAFVSADEQEQIHRILKSPSQSEVDASMKAARDENSTVETVLELNQEQEKIQGVLKSGNLIETAARLKESQETMRNLIEQHAIVDTDLATVRQVRESPRSSQERSMKAAGDENASIQSNLAQYQESRSLDKTLQEGRKESNYLKTAASTEEETQKDVNVEQQKSAYHKTDVTSKIAAEQKETAHMKAAGNEKQGIDTKLTSLEENEQIQGVMKSASQAEITAKLRESQETMRNLIEQHEIVDNNLVTASRFRESQEATEERYIKALSEENQEVTASVTSTEKQQSADTTQREIRETALQAAVTAAGDEKAVAENSIARKQFQEEADTIQKSASQLSVSAQMTASRDERKNVESSIISPETQEGAQGVMKSPSEIEVAKRVKESQETMRNLIEQHEIVDTDLAAISNIRETARSSEERTLKAASEEMTTFAETLEQKQISSQVSIAQAEAQTGGISATFTETPDTSPGVVKRSTKEIAKGESEMTATAVGLRPQSSVEERSSVIVENALVVNQGTTTTPIQINLIEKLVSEDELTEEYEQVEIMQIERSEKHQVREDKTMEEARMEMTETAEAPKVQKVSEENVDGGTFVCQITSDRQKKASADISVPEKREHKEEYRTKVSKTQKSEEVVELQEAAQMQTSSTSTFEEVKVLDTEIPATHTVIDSVKPAALQERPQIQEIPIQLVDETTNTFKEENIELKSLSGEWRTILNELEFELVEAERVREEASIRTHAVSESAVETNHEMRKREASETQDFRYPVIPNEEQNQRFGVAVAELTDTFTKSGNNEEFHKKLSEVTKETGNSVTFIESSNESMDSGILLVQMPMGKKSARVDHIVDVSATLCQTLKTQAVSDVETLKTVEWSGFSSDASTDFILKQRNKAEAHLKARASKTENIEAGGMLLHTPSTSSVERKLTQANEASGGTLPLVETSADGVDILSSWKTVFRDLEAHIDLANTLNLYSRLTTVESSEQFTSVSEQWNAGQQSAHTTVTIPVKLMETVAKTFGIASAPEVETNLTRPQQVQEGAEKKHLIARSESGLIICQPSGDVKFSAQINLHQIDAMKQPKVAETIVPSSYTISAGELATEAADSDQTTVNTQLAKGAPMERIEKKIISARSIPSEEFDCEAAGNEKAKLAVDLQGRGLNKEEIIKTVVIPRTTQSAKLDADEFEEDEALLYAQITSNETRFGDSNIDITLPRTIEPSILKTKAASDEKMTVNEHWNIQEPKETAEKRVVIPFEGSPAFAKMFEMTEKSAQVGYVYEKEVQSTAVEKIQKDSNFSGLIVLDTKAASREDKNIAMNLSRRQENEQIKRKLVQRSLSELSFRTLESIHENMTTSYSFNRSPSTDDVGQHRKCANVYPPLKQRLLESRDEVNTVNYQWRRDEQKEGVDKLNLIPNFGGGFKLQTDAAEDVKLQIERLLERVNEFEKKEITIIGSNRGEPQTLTTNEATLEEFHTQQGFNRPQSDAMDALTIRDKNRDSAKIKAKESTDVSQITYTEFRQPLSKETLSKTIVEKNDGGKFYLRTQASELDERDFTRELQDSRSRIEKIDKTYIISNTAEPLSLSTPSSKKLEKGLHAALQKTEQRERAASVERASHSISAALRVVESSNVESILHANYFHDDEAEISEFKKIIAADGGKLGLQTKAAGDANVEKNLDIASGKPTTLDVEKKVKTSRDEKLLHKTPASTEIQSHVFEDWKKEADRKDIGILLTAANSHPALHYRTLESTTIEQVTNCQLRKPNDVSDQSTKLINEKRNGGSFFLRTNYVTEETATLPNGNLIKDVPRDLGVAKVIKCSNTAILEPFHSRASTSKDLSVHCQLYRPQSSLQTILTTKAPNTSAPQTLKVRESESHASTTNIDFQKSESHQGVEKTTIEPNFGGSLYLRTPHASEKTITLENTIYNPASNQSFTEYTAKCANSLNDYLLQCLEAGDSDAGYLSHMLRKPDIELTGTTLRSALHAEPFILRVKESQERTENINCQWSRLESNEDITEIKKDKRFGGNIVLRVEAAGDENVTLNQDIANPKARDKDLSAPEKIIVLKREGEPQKLNTGFAKDSTTSMITQLQKPDSYFAAGIQRPAARTTENPSVKITESKQVEQMTNVQLKRPEQYQYDDRTIYEARFGGSFFLSTSRSEDKSIDVQRDISKPQAAQGTHLTLKAANNHEPILRSCGHSTQEEQNTTWALQSSKLFHGETTIVLAAPNK